MPFPGLYQLFLFVSAASAVGWPAFQWIGRRLFGHFGLVLPRRCVRQSLLSIRIDKCVMSREIHTCCAAAFESDSTIARGPQRDPCFSCRFVLRWSTHGWAFMCSNLENRSCWGTSVECFEGNCGFVDHAPAIFFYSSSTVWCTSCSWRGGWYCTGPSTAAAACKQTRTAHDTSTRYPGRLWIRHRDR